MSEIRPTGLQRLQGNLSLVVLFTVLTASLVLNVFLGLELKIRSTPGVSQAGIQEAVRLPAMPVLDRQGARSVLTFEVPTVLYMLDPSCSWCERNVENIKALAAARARDFRFVGLSLTDKGLLDYLEQVRYPFEVFFVDSRSWALNLGLGPTPQMAVVSKGGLVERSWSGAAEGTRQEEIEAFFHTKLPGLVATSTVDK